MNGQNVTAAAISSSQFCKQSACQVSRCIAYRTPPHGNTSVAVSVVRKCTVLDEL
ncbi:hypothetical protein DL89DRAFT_263944 [Linderina pennispora]|uniref:Uncharacterized protein n=1 Tax=Linderina pennispora TaxID=61395 RepID=A0A1Y1WKC4_9FUNG|nr:uncharacterized protein DL89DRAFT_263944 [Linderina pennispora]ORX73933.1 hypothetical protein DL89DRAFT_263944 [Linderina pennispora]